MKKILLFCSIAATQPAIAQNSIGIGTTSPDPASVLDVSSSTKGLLIPRVTNPALDALAGRAGMMAYNVDDNNFVGYVNDKPVTSLNVPQSTNPGSLALFSMAGQTFKLPASATTAVPIHDIGIRMSNNFSAFTFSVNVYEGAGTAGLLLGSGFLSLPAASGAGMKYVNIAAANVVLQPGTTYTFTVNKPNSAMTSGISYSADNPYGDGYMFTGSTNNPTQDMVFQVRGKGELRLLHLAAVRDITYTSPLYSGSIVHVSAYEIRATKVGSIVTLTFPTDLTTMNVSSSQSSITANIPDGFRPAFASLLPVRVVSGGNITMGLAFLDPANGRVNLRANVGGTNWGGANSGFTSFSITYPAQQ